MAVWQRRESLAPSAVTVAISSPSGDLVQQLRQDRAVTVAAGGIFHRPDVRSGRVHGQMDLAPLAAGTKVSVNTVHKWMNGASRPREDRIRELARVLDEDELWLSMGRKPETAAEAAAAALASSSASGALMAAAGLIEMAGGKVVVSTERASPFMVVNFGGFEARVMVVAATVANADLSFVIPEPVGDLRVLAVVPGATNFAIRVYDITGLPRQPFAGFSVAQARQQPGGISSPDGKQVIHPFDSVQSMLGTVQGAGAFAGQVLNIDT